MSVTKNQNSFYLLILLFLMNAGAVSFGQSQFEKENKSNFFRCGETIYALVIKDEKTGLYNLSTDAYSLKPTSNFYYFSESLNYLFEAYPDGRILLYNLERKTEKGEVLMPCMTAQDALVLNNYWSKFDESAVKLVNGGIGYVTETESGTVLDGILGGVPGYAATTLEARCTYNSKTSAISNSTFSIGLERRENFVIVSDYFSDGENSFNPIKSIFYPDEDSLDATGQLTFAVPPVNAIRSGVFNITTKEWDIPQHYQKVYSVGDLLICLAQDRVGEHYYDVYFFHPHGYIESTAFKNIRRNRDFPAYLLFNEWHTDEELFDSIVFEEKYVRQYKYDLDSTYFYFSHYKTHQKGMLHFQLFDEKMNRDYSTNKGPARFEIDTIFAPIHDFVVKTGIEQPHFFAYGDGHFNAAIGGDGINHFPVSFNDYFFTEARGYYYVDNSLYYDTCYDNSIFLLKMDGTYDAPKFAAHGINKWDDSLICINYFETKGLGDFTALISLEYPGEDSINEYGEIIYDQEYSVSYSSGVYDLKNKTWQIDRNYAWIVRSQDGFLLCEPIVDVDGVLQEYRFSFKTKDGNYVFKHIDEKTFYQDNAYTRYLIAEYAIDSMYRVSDHLRYLYYFKVGSKTGLYDLQSQTLQQEPSDLLYYNEQFDLSFAINNGQLKVAGRGMEKAVPINADTDLSYYVESNSSQYDQDLHLFDLSADTNELAHYSYYEGEYFYSWPTDEQVTAEVYRLLAKSPEGFRIKGINDSLLYIENWSRDQLFGEITTPKIYAERFRSFKDAPLPEFAVGRSGVYNMHAGQWLIAPKYMSIIALANGNFIVESPVLDKKGFTISSEFTIVDADEKVILPKTTLKNLPVEYQILISQ